MKNRQQVNIHLSSEDAETIRSAAGWRTDSTGEAVQALVTKGIRATMTEHAKPVSKFYLDVSTSWANIIQEYRKFEDAVARDAGMVGPLGSTHRFVQIPADCDEYADADPKKPLYIVLHDKFDLGPNGEAILRRE